MAPAERHEPGLLDALRKRRVRRDAVGHGFDGRLRVERDDGLAIRSVACGPTITTPSSSP
jgi:hypothetical protein